MNISEAAQKHLDTITDGASLACLDPVDRDTLRRYCESFARWVDAEHSITEHGMLVKGSSGFPSESPYMSISHKYSSDCSKMEIRIKKILEQLKYLSKR